MPNSAPQPDPIDPPALLPQEGPLPEDIFFKELAAKMATQGLNQDDIHQTRQAYLFAKEKHEGQKRKSNENYIVHPVHVALILAEMGVDPHTLQSALLHDVLEDTDATGDD